VSAEKGGRLSTRGHIAVGASDSPVLRVLPKSCYRVEARIDAGVGSVGGIDAHTLLAVAGGDGGDPGALHVHIGPCGRTRVAVASL